MLNSVATLLNDERLNHIITFSDDIWKILKLRDLKYLHLVWHQGMYLKLQIFSLENVFLNNPPRKYSTMIEIRAIDDMSTKFPYSYM
jgi:hypothetical protein